MAPPVTRSPAAVDGRSIIRGLVVSGGSDIAIVLDRLPADQMLEHDALRARDIDARVPGVFGIDHDHRAMPALIHATGVIHTHETLQPGGTDAFLERLVNVLGTLRRTLLPRRADEHMVFVLAHAVCLFDQERGRRSEEFNVVYRPRPATGRRRPPHSSLLRCRRSFFPPMSCESCSSKMTTGRSTVRSTPHDGRASERRALSSRRSLTTSIWWSAARTTVACCGLRSFSRASWSWWKDRNEE